VAQQVVSSKPPIQRKCKACPLKRKRKSWCSVKLYRHLIHQVHPLQITLSRTSDPASPLTRQRAHILSPVRARLKRVRIHTDARAAEAARVLYAAAFTSGRDVVFAGVDISLGLPQDMLLAHELAHVVQQADKVGA